jgi:5-methylthioadenosine/S-adenosylhomocysteine deaminase
MTSCPEPKYIDTLLQAAWILPIAPHGTVLRDHCVALADGEIVELLPSTQARQQYPEATHFNLNHHALMPGFVNTHGHLAMSLMRGLADDLPLMIWLSEHIWPTESRWVSAEFVRDGSRLAMAEMIKSGTTCFSDMYFFPNIVAQEAAAIGMRGQICAPILDFPTAWASDAQDYIDKALSLAKQYRDHPLLSFGLGPHAPYTVSDAPLQRISQLARELRLPVQIHLHETRQEVDQALQATRKRPILRLHELGLLSPDIHLQCVHMTELNADDIQIIRQAGAHVLHCPESNLKLASGLCPVVNLMQNGVNVALGTDGAASNNDLDMLGELRTAALLAKAVAGDAAAVDAHAALAMATLNGAKALGLDHLIGSIEPGKRADLIALDLNELNTLPAFNPASNIVYAASSSQITHCWIDGKLQMKNRQLLAFDERELKRNALEWAHRIQPSIL